MTKIKQIEHFQTRVHTFSLLMPIGDFHQSVGQIQLQQASEKKKEDKFYSCS